MYFHGSCPLTGDHTYSCGVCGEWCKAQYQQHEFLSHDREQMIFQLENKLASTSIMFTPLFSQNTTNVDNAYYELFPLPKDPDPSSPECELILCTIITQNNSSVFAHASVLVCSTTYLLYSRKYSWDSVSCSQKTVNLYVITRIIC